MAESWLTIAKVCALTGLTERHVRRTSRTWETRISESRGHNGKREREYLLSSLPAEAQAKFAEESRKGLLVVPAAERTLPLFPSAPYSSEPPRIAVPDDLADEARAKLKAIEPLLDFRQGTNGHRPAMRLGDGRTVNTLNDLVAYIAAQQKPPVSSRTVYRWLGRFDKGGYAALAEKPRKDKGQSRFFEEHPTGASFLEQKFLNEGLSREMAWEALCRAWKDIDGRGEPPCYGTARSFLNSLALPEPLKVLGREGPQAHWSKCSPFIQRAEVPVMDWWVSDHRVFDVLVRNSLFPELPENKAFRIWLTALYDWGSRKLVGFCFAPTPSSRTINSALRIAILSHGMPRNLYWDNGEDFKKVRRDLEAVTLSDEARALLERDRVGITSALRYRPRSKPIESWFGGRWSKRFDPQWRPAYLGNKPGACPEFARESQRQHEDFLKGKRADSPLPLDATFIAAAIQFIDEENDTRREKLQGHTPNEAMEQAHPERNRGNVDRRMLDILFSERTKRIVQKGGCVQLDGMRYEPTNESLCALDIRQGREVAILRDPYNLGEATAADAETLQFIGELQIQEFVAQCPNGRITRDQIKAGVRRERSLRRGYAEYLATLSALATNQGWKTEREALVERAIARTGTDGRLLPAAVPGSRGNAAPARARRATQPAFVSDAVAEEPDFMSGVKIED